MNGPGDVTAMFIANGLLLAPFDLQSPTGGEGMETVTFSVMLPQPVLAAGQFRRAIASASIAGLASYAAAGDTAFAGHSFDVTTRSVDADYDDESGQMSSALKSFLVPTRARLEFRSSRFR